MTSGSWSDTTKWDLHRIPNSADSVFIDSLTNCNVDIAAECGSLRSIGRLSISNKLKIWGSDTSEIGFIDDIRALLSNAGPGTLRIDTLGQVSDTLETVGGGGIIVGGSGNLVNNKGIISIAPGGWLSLQSSLVNSGNVSLENGARVNFAGDVAGSGSFNFAPTSTVSYSGGMQRIVVPDRR